MSVNIRFPKITGRTEAEQLAQIKSYLHQLVEQLNWALDTIESAPESSGETAVYSGDINPAMVEELKAQVIKATSELDEYYGRINSKLSDYVHKDSFKDYQTEVAQSFDDLGNQYVSQDDYTAYKEEVSQGFDQLGEQYVAQTDFDAYVQGNAEAMSGLDTKYVLKTVFDAYAEETTTKLNSLQQEVDELRQAIESMQETGGE